MVLKLVTALPWRACRPESIWSARMGRDHPFSNALAAYQSRSSGLDSLSRSRQWCVQGICAAGCCTITGTRGAVRPSGACTSLDRSGLLELNCATGGCTITISGQASAKARMYFRFRGEKPCCPGNAFWRSWERRSMTFAPHPSACWRSRIIRPRSQYSASNSLFAASPARICAARTRALISVRNCP